MIKVSACPECGRLREVHVKALLEHVRLRYNVREALRRKKRRLLAALVVAEAEALRDCKRAEAALRHPVLTHADAEKSVPVRLAG